MQIESFPGHPNVQHYRTFLTFDLIMQKVGGMMTDGSLTLKQALVLLTYLASIEHVHVGNKNVDKILLWNKVALKYSARWV